MATVAEVAEDQLPLKPPPEPPRLFVLVVCQRCQRQLHTYVTGGVPAIKHDCEDQSYKVKAKS